MDVVSEVELLPKTPPSRSCNPAVDDSHPEDFSMHNFITVVGRYFRIRDDYQNLCSPAYSKQKGFCEDLDKGKYSLPLIHVLAYTNIKMQLEAILLERKKKDV
jgi:geranylgeranyl pyrophosphate synthase